MESVPHDVVELILERLSVKTLVRFKAVSKQWRSTIESSIFQARQLIHRQKSGDPDVLMVSVRVVDRDSNTRKEYLRTLVLGSSSYVNIPIPWENRGYIVCENSCDGLVCLYYNKSSICSLVFNPATRWHRLLPLSRLQQRMKDKFIDSVCLSPPLGFGKDIINNIYKPVWLYNSRDNATTCEVFDFSTNAWRYVTPTPPYRILPHQSPVYINGSLYWLTNCEEIKLLSFDLHTETFQVIMISKAPFDIENGITTCNLGNRLYVSIYEQESSTNVIWSLDSDNKTWEKLSSIPVDRVSGLLQPLAILYKNKTKLLFYHPLFNQELVTFDIESKAYDVSFCDKHIGFPVCYFQSLVSIL